LKFFNPFDVFVFELQYTEVKASNISLNNEQRQSVKTIDGPLLVIAGPGTGKTQLLSARVAYILQNTDTLAENILCLTFTESAAFNMRERLETIIGQDANRVNISTYHSFGSDIIKNYSEYFEKIFVDKTKDQRLERPIDELLAIQIVSDILARLEYGNPLLSARYYVKSIVGTISELKRALIDPNALRRIATENLKQVELLADDIDQVINSQNGISRKKAEALNQYHRLCDALSGKAGDLCKRAYQELAAALDEATETKSNKGLTKWKNKWLFKNDLDNFEFTRKLDHQKMLAMADIFESYETYLKLHGLYDFDDMILRTIETVKTNDELRYTLQEKYQYIMLDEFQDTNPSQFELVHLIADHPVHEGRPNIMAVGDDDQAIYAFQGADVGNMRKFLDSYRDVTVINLTQNYRSHHQIIEVAHNVSSQIEDRVHHALQNIEKELIAASDSLPKKAELARHIFQSQAEEYAWTAKEIKKLIVAGTEPSEIAVLSPRHSLLEAMVPFLKSQSIPVSYEKREDILHSSIIMTLQNMVKLVDALSRNDSVSSNQYFPVVLSENFWNIAVADIWKVNWARSEKDQKQSWGEIALEYESLAKPVLFFLKLALINPQTPLETMLDYLTGNEPLQLDNDITFLSPLKSYYFENNQHLSTLDYFEAVAYLSVIRSKLRDYQANREDKLTIDDFLNLLSMYETAEQPLLNTHPVSESENAVQLMTAYKAKGLEFQYVFILSAHDDVWGKSSRGQSNKLSLPENLTHIRYRGSSVDELRRLFFVAITRAKHGLYVTSHAQKESGKMNKPLAYLNEHEGRTGIFPHDNAEVIQSNATIEQIMQDNETLWLARHVNLDTSLKDLLKPRLDSYKMSPTHLNTFVDVERGGPDAFLVGTLLRFPQAPSASGEYGTAVHNTLEWYQNQINAGHKTKVSDALRYAKQELMRRYLTANDLPNKTRQIEEALSKYLIARHEMFARPAKTEVNFAYEGVVVNGARLSGKIDRLEINEDNKTISIADYKTGAGFNTWKTRTDLKSLKYEQQLYMYKILVENSNSYRNYTVKSARLEFVEPNSAGQIIAPQLIDFDEEKQKEIVALIGVVWESIQSLQFPDTSKYPENISGVHEFIANLLD